MHTLSNRASFWVAAAVAAVALWTSAAPSVTYPLYATEWHLSLAVTTLAFAMYPIALVLVLVISGDLSDHMGRRAAIVLGLTASLAGALLFAVATNVGFILAGRALMGVGVGLALSPATAAMVEFSPAGRSDRAGAITTAATSVGLVLATLVGGGLIQYAPYPTHLNFWILAVAVAAVLVVACFLPGPPARGTTPGWRPQVPAIPEGQ